MCNLTKMCGPEQHRTRGAEESTVTLQHSEVMVLGHGYGLWEAIAFIPGAEPQVGKTHTQERQTDVKTKAKLGSHTSILLCTEHLPGS